MSRCKKKEKKPTVRVFEGVLYAPNDTGKCSWICEDEHDATKSSADEEWFAWAEKKKVRITIERLP
jgi:hypothetical protein